MEQSVHPGYFFDPKGLNAANKAVSEGLTVVDSKGKPCRSAAAVLATKKDEKPRRLPKAKPAKRRRRYSLEIETLRVSLERTQRSRKLLLCCLVIFTIIQALSFYILYEVKSSSRIEELALKREINDLTYVSSYLLKTVKGGEDVLEEETKNDEGLDTVTVNVDRLNLRAAPNIEARKITSVEKGNVLLALKIEDEWVKVISPAGVVAWGKLELFS